MRFQVHLRRIIVIPALLLLVTACGHKNSGSEAGSTGPASTDGKHYTQADFAAKCFKYPDRMMMLQYKAFGFQGQDAIDYKYLQETKQFSGPSGECDFDKQIAADKARAQAAPKQQQQQGWIENAPANDMSHYGDALPGAHHQH